MTLADIPTIAAAWFAAACLATWLWSRAFGSEPIIITYTRMNTEQPCEQIAADASEAGRGAQSHHGEQQ